MRFSFLPFFLVTAAFAQNTATIYGTASDSGGSVACSVGVHPMVP